MYVFHGVLRYLNGLRMDCKLWHITPVGFSPSQAISLLLYSERALAGNCLTAVEWVTRCAKPPLKTSGVERN